MKVSWPDVSTNPAWVLTLTVLLLMLFNLSAVQRSGQCLLFLNVLINNLIWLDSIRPKDLPSFGVWWWWWKLLDGTPVVWFTWFLYLLNHPVSPVDCNPGRDHLHVSSEDEQFCIDLHLNPHQHNLAHRHQISVYEFIPLICPPSLYNIKLLSSGCTQHFFVVNSLIIQVAQST